MFYLLDFFILPRYLGLTGAADAIDIKRIAVLTETFRGHLLHGSTDLIGLDFHDLATHRTDLMTMAGIVVTSLVLRRALKTVTDHQAQLHEQIERIVHRSPAHMKIHLPE